jgi:hypothetical protein
MLRATFEKSVADHAQQYFKAPYYRGRTQAHRRGWLTSIQIQAVCMGPLRPFFIFRTKHDEQTSRHAPRER